MRNTNSCGGINRVLVEGSSYDAISSLAEIIDKTGVSPIAGGVMTLSGTLGGVVGGAAGFITSLITSVDDLAPYISNKIHHFLPNSDIPKIVTGTIQFTAGLGTISAGTILGIGAGALLGCIGGYVASSPIEIPYQIYKKVTK